jgi:hypothetical protein
MRPGQNLVATVRLQLFQLWDLRPTRLRGRPGKLQIQRVAGPRFASLPDCRIPDVSPEVTKWKRLYNAFVACHNAHQIGNRNPLAHNPKIEWEMSEQDALAIETGAEVVLLDERKGVAQRANKD